MRHRLLALASLLATLSLPVQAQTVYGLFGLPSPNIGNKQLGTLDPTDGSVALTGASTSIDSDTVSVGTGITAIAVAGDVFYFIGQDAGDSISKVYTVDLDTGATTASPALSAFSSGLTLGLWYDNSTSTLWGLFSNGGDRAVASVDPTTGTVTSINAAIAGENLTTAGGVFTGDPDGDRVFFVGTPDSGDPTLYEVSTLGGTVTPWLFEDYDQNTVMGIEWDPTLAQLWLIVHRGSGRQLASYNFGEEFVELAPGEIDFGDTVTTSTGLTTLDDASGQLFFIGRPDIGNWSVYTVDVPGGDASSQEIDGSLIQINGWAGFEIIPGPELSVTKDDGGATAIPGDIVTWTLTASNAAGAGPAEGVMFSEAVPAETIFSPADSTAGWTCLPDNTAGSTCTLSRPDLAPGSSDPVLFAVQIDASVSPDLTQIDNTVTLSATNTTSTVMASDATPVTAAANILFTKSDGNVSVVPGDTIVYNLTAQNTGDADAIVSALTETVPANTTFTAASSTSGWSCADGASAGTACTFAIGTIEGGAQAAIDFAVTVVPSVAAGTTEIANQAMFTADNPISLMAADTTPVTSAPDLALDKSDGAISSAPAAVVPYVLTYTNNGDQDAATATLTETVPAQSTFNGAASTAGWSCLPDSGAGSTCTFDIGTVAGNGGTGNVTFAVSIDDPVLAGTTEISNSATFDATNAPAAAMASDTTPVVAAPSLTLTKSDGGVTTRPGRSLSYVLIYGNDGNENAADVVLTETVPADTTFDSKDSSPGWVCVPDGSAGSTCIFDVGTLTGGDTGLAFFAVDVDDPYLAAGSDITNSASVDASNAPAPANAQDTTPVDARLDLAVTKDDGGITARPDGVIAYTIGWDNVGTQTATAVVISETVPTDTSFDAGASSPGWTCTPDGSAGSTCTYAIASLAPTAAGSATFAVVVDDPTVATSIDNTVTIADDGALGADINPADNSASTTTDVDLLPPTVVSIDAVPSIGGLGACSQLDAKVTSLAVELEDDFTGVVDADLLGSYLVVSTGPDGDLDTSACGPVFGDDIEVPLSNVSVSGGPTNPTATLTLSQPLTNGIHLLLVCDAIEDGAGNRLDGDGDGTAGGDLSRRFRIDIDNLFANAQLDDCPEAPIALPPWTDDAVPPSQVVATLDADIDGSSLSGAIEIQIGNDTPVSVGQCVDTTITAQAVEARVRGTINQLDDLEVNLWCAVSDTPACANLQPSETLDAMTVSPSVTPQWIRLLGRRTAAGPVASIACGVTATSPNGFSENLAVDDLFLGGLIFADGFESGTTGAWSLTVPQP